MFKNNIRITLVNANVFYSCNIIGTFEKSILLPTNRLLHQPEHQSFEIYLCIALF